MASDKGLHPFTPCTIASYHYIHIYYLYVSYHIHHIVLIAKKSAWITFFLYPKQMVSNYPGKEIMRMEHCLDGYGSFV